MAPERSEDRSADRDEDEAERPLGRWRRALLMIPLAILAGVGIAWWAGRVTGAASTAKADSSGANHDRDPAATRVRVAHPRRGGIARSTSQPGVIHPFESADLYAKASGFLRGQVVDIGDPVERGQVLAEVFDPERQQAVEEAAAAVAQAEARVDQAEAEVLAAEAEVLAAEAEVDQREAAVGQDTATRRRAEKEYLRYQELSANRVVDERVVDEKQADFESARAGERVALAAVRNSEGRLAKATAQVATAQAGVKTAEADVLAARAQQSRAEILAGYTDLTSPYDGVVTARNYHRGDFIRAATSGEGPPVLSVARTDLMRVVIYVPDTDVPDLDRDDPAVVRVDALHGEEFRGTVSRYSGVEMSASRSMRAEVDLPNPSGRLKAGMYGMTTILLEPPDSNVLVVPSSALAESSEHGEGAVFVVEEGKAHRRPIRVGKDDGRIVEVLSGLEADDAVVISYSGSIEDGVPVEATSVDQGS